MGSTGAGSVSSLQEVNMMAMLIIRATENSLMFFIGVFLLSCKNTFSFL
jgi:hypothetical protein